MYAIHALHYVTFILKTNMELICIRLLDPHLRCASIDCMSLCHHDRNACRHSRTFTIYNLYVVCLVCLFAIMTDTLADSRLHLPSTGRVLYVLFFFFFFSFLCMFVCYPVSFADTRVH